MMILSLKYIQQKMEDLVAHIGYVNSSKKMVFILIGSTSHQKLNICTRASCPAASISTCGPNRPLLVMIRYGRRVWRGFEKYKVSVSLRSTKYNTFSNIITQTKPWSIQKSFWSSIFLMSSMISKSLRLKSWYVTTINKKRQVSCFFLPWKRLIMWLWIKYTAKRKKANKQLQVVLTSSPTLPRYV